MFYLFCLRKILVVIVFKFFIGFDFGKTIRIETFIFPTYNNMHPESENVIKNECKTSEIMLTWKSL